MSCMYGLPFWKDLYVVVRPSQKVNMGDDSSWPCSSVNCFGATTGLEDLVLKYIIIKDYLVSF